MLDGPNAPLTDTAKPALALKPLLPGEKGFNGVTCFGGNPRLPDSLEWPCDGARRPLHFLFQIDCTELEGADSDFPTEGTLFFFGGCNFDNNDEDDRNTLGGATGSCVLYWPDAVDDEEERVPPENTRNCTSTPMSSKIRGTAHSILIVASVRSAASTPPPSPMPASRSR